MKYVLAIETSCDDTCICVMDMDFNIIFEKSISQVDLHAKYGGVVPELASRAHMQYLQILLNEMRNFVRIEDIAAICPTFAPGLIGGLLAGVVVAKGIAHRYGKKLISVHHLQGHLESVNINKKTHVDYPNLTLLISGGHAQFILSENFGKYKIIGRTLDDSIGEAFDKCGKMLGIDYPAGAKIEKLANFGRNIPQIGSPMKNNTLDFSLSGFKTNVRNFIQKNEAAIDELKNDICFTVQSRICENIALKLEIALEKMQKEVPNLQDFILCGGVAANKTIIAKVEEICKKFNITAHYPQLKYATDNAAMIAVAGVKLYKQGKFSSLDISPKNRFNIEDL